MDNFLLGVASGMGIGALVVGIVLGSAIEQQLRSEAIERGYAQYCPHNGQWQWKGECDE